VLITKTDLLPYLPVDICRIKDHIYQVNPHCTVIHVSATSGEGLDDWHAWLRQQKAILLAGQQHNQSRPTVLAPASDSDHFSNAVHQQH
jgi:hydrogenase nickel incorporation protein HypB